ncbi:MAG TPA: penicillin acylase family protein, partial [Candidatus Dormibacteraeota bacterium]|nr:penicillin acylase family protein [Candidatus Dormibacteraeota bacterium]
MTFDPAIEAPVKKQTSVRRPRVAADRGSGGTSRGRSAINVIAALIVTAAVLYAAFAGAGPLPALGPAFNPVTGAWTMAADAANSSQSQTLRLAGLEKPVNVTLEADGTSHIVAQTDHDLFLATGYIHARFRLFQMDLLRRQGEGRLSEVVGKAALDSDRFELQLGLLRTAQVEWNAASSRSRLAGIAYAQGVNDRITEAETNHQLPAMFALLGYQPKPWTPIDSLIVKGDMTQTLNFTDTPLVMALLEKSLGADLTSQWFPTLPPNPQSPYDPGPYAPAVAPAPIAAVSQVTNSEAVA